MSLGNFSNSFYTLADKLITEVNATVISLRFKNQNLGNISNTFDNQPNTLDRLGGRVRGDQLDGRRDQDVNNKVEEFSNKSLTVRAYWDPKETLNDLEKLNIKHNTHICKIISFASDVQDLLNCDYIIVDGYECQMIIDPVYHGLGGNKRYATTYWRRII